jgi:hypothetical protein
MNFVIYLPLTWLPADGKDCRKLIFNQIKSDGSRWRVILRKKREVVHEN